MPRIKLDRKRYKILDMKGWIVGQMKIHGLTQSDIAEALGLSQSTISAMLKIPEDGRSNIDQISYGDLLTLFELFDTPNDEKVRLLTL